MGGQVAHRRLNADSAPDTLSPARTRLQQICDPARRIRNLSSPVVSPVATGEPREIDSGDYRRLSGFIGEVSGPLGKALVGWYSMHELRLRAFSLKRGLTGVRIVEDRFRTELHTRVRVPLGRRKERLANPVRIIEPHGYRETAAQSSAASSALVARCVGASKICWGGPDSAMTPSAMTCTR
jgi:hypothetical protein